MKWDPDRAVTELESFTTLRGPTEFSKRYVPAEAMHNFPRVLPQGADFANQDTTIATIPIWTLSVLTDSGRRYFYGRSAHEAFLKARKALRPKHRPRKKKDDRPRKPRSAE